jgi:hypothetical protein
MADAVSSHIATGLGREDVDVCGGASVSPLPAPALAKITVSSRRDPDGSWSVRVDIDDAVTSKIVSRRLSLARIPDDGLALAIAAGVEELLRASWAELDAPATPLARTPPRPPAIGTRMTYASWDGGQEQLGVDLVYVRPLAGRFGLDLSLGGRRGLSEEAAGGTVDAVSFGGGASVWLAVAEAGPLRLDLEGGVWAGFVRFDADARTGFQSEAVTGAVVVGRIGLAPSVTLGRLTIGMSATAGAPIVGIEAEDAAGDHTGLTGLELAVAIGGSLAL